jgi:hypothetical protein
LTTMLQGGWIPSSSCFVFGLWIDMSILSWYNYYFSWSSRCFCILLMIDGKKALCRSIQSIPRSAANSRDHATTSSKFLSLSHRLPCVELLLVLLTKWLLLTPMSVRHCGTIKGGSSHLVLMLKETKNSIRNNRRYRRYIISNNL